MQILVVAVGKIKEPFLREGVAEYEKRLRPYVNLQIAEVADEKRPVSASPSLIAAAQEKEAVRIMSAIPGGAFVVALDIKGQACSSEDLAGFLRERELAGVNPVTFVIGGDTGLAPAVLSRCSLSLSLSKMTFTHPMARLLLLEQLYRAFRIKAGEPYHK